MRLSRRKFLRAGALFLPATYVRAIGFKDPQFVKNLYTGAGVPICPDGSTAMSAYLTNVAGMGGTAPSSAIQNAMGALYCGMEADGYLSKFVFMQTYSPTGVGDGTTNLGTMIAAVCPLIYSGSTNPTSMLSGLVTQANSNTTALSANGVLSITANWAMNPFIDITASLTPTSAGLTTYTTGGVVTTNGAAIGCFNSSLSPPAAFYLFPNYGDGNAYFAAWNATTGQLGAALPGGAGFFGYVSGNRTGATAQALYVANSTHAHASIGTNSGASGSNSQSNFNSPLIYAVSNQNFLASTTAYDQQMRHSLNAIHLGLTLSESAMFSARYQTFRTACGGGFI
jgi:hypothetical protein